MAGGLGVSARVAQTTIEEWARKVSEETEKHLPIMQLLRSRGRVKNGCSGGGMRWVVRQDDHDLEAFVDMTPINYKRVNTKTNAYLPWRGYQVVDAISLQEKYEQGGKEAMIKVFANREETMRRGAIRGFSDKLYIDGNANTDDMHGIESFMSIGTQTATDKLQTSSDDTYAGLSTARSQANTATDFWTPVVVNTNRTVGGATEAFADFADQYLRTGILESTYGTGPGNMIDLITLNRDAYEAFLNLLDDKERLNVSRGQAFGKSNLGFKSIAFDGVDVIWDAAVPSTDDAGDTVRGYGWTVDQMELRLLNKSGLFSGRTTYNDLLAADHIFLHMIGNFKFNPRHFVKFADIAAHA